MKTNEKTVPILAEKDRNAISLELMNRMKLHGMAAAFTESLSSTFAEAATPDSFLNWLLSREWDYRSEVAIQRLIHMASFRYKAYPEEIDYTISRGLDRNQMERLAWSSSGRRKTSSSPVRPVQERVSWPPHWDTRHASPESAPFMQTPRNFWGR